MKMRTIEDASYLQITTDQIIDYSQIIGQIRYNTQRQCQMDGDAILSVQLLKLREVGKLRWDGASESIQAEVPERATMTQ